MILNDHFVQRKFKLLEVKNRAYDPTYRMWQSHQSIKFGLVDFETTNLLTHFSKWHHDLPLGFLEGLNET